MITCIRCDAPIKVRSRGLCNKHYCEFLLTRDPSIARNPPVRWTKEMKQAVRDLRAEGRSLADIARQIGVDDGTLRKYRKVAGLKLAPIRCGWSLDREKK